MNTYRDSRPRQRRKIQKGLRSDQNIFLSIPIQRARQKKAGKTKRVGIKAQALKVYLEYKSQPKEVTAFPPRDIKYKKEKQLIGLRDKPITKQDALPRSEYQPRYLPGQDPLSLLRHPLCHPILADCRSPCIDKVEALTINSNTTAV
ncbi:hypothetical protein V6N13_001844 [Hibiscus sabdariffa]